MRTVCCLPECSAFGPINQSQNPENTVQMTVDEYETLRLIDYEGLMQEECATQMNVARTTVQSIYSVARQKIADALVNHKWLMISGGDIVIENNNTDSCCKRQGARHGCHCGMNRENAHVLTKNEGEKE
jgi:predicted DNA-binding protein (UPF0251 family)